MNSCSALLQFMVSLSAQGPAATAPMQPAAGISLQNPLTFTSGTGSLQTDMVLVQQGTLTAGTLVTLTLTALTDVFGQAWSAARAKGLVVLNNATSSGNILFGGSNNNFAWVSPATASKTLTPGSFLAIGAADATGMVVTASTGDKMVLQNTGSAAAMWQVFLIGASV